MPIIDLQKRTRELGRIRIGQTVPTSNGRNRPTKLDRFRLTSASRPLLDQVAELYGGQVREWTPANGGPQQWEVITDSARLPVLVPPQPVSQWYELWSGGGCQRRCDGQREVLRDIVCPCGPDPAARECKPTTRLNVVLRDVPGVGVWRLESHGYYAAVELPAVAELLAQTRGYIQAWLALEERTAKRDGTTLRWMVPTLEVDITPAQLMAGEGGVAPAVAAPSASAVAPAVAPAAAIESGTAPAAASGEIPETPWLGRLTSCRTADEVRTLWREAAAAGALTPYLREQMTNAAAELTALAEGAPVADAPRVPMEEPQDVEAPPAPAPAPAPAAPPVDVDALWFQIVSAAGEADPPLAMSQLEEEFARRHDGRLPASATAEELQAFLAEVRGGWVSAAAAAPTAVEESADQPAPDAEALPF